MPRSYRADLSCWSEDRPDELPESIARAGQKKAPLDASGAGGAREMKEGGASPLFGAQTNPPQRLFLHLPDNLEFLNVRIDWPVLQPGLTHCEKDRPRDGRRGSSIRGHSQ
ncbi:hypothetical protein BN77_p11652 [Rhizobium mesoamericanum STM3625]|uniref:Uncharacterized protein n=1 Tax=Rhizobium mesoamericanum STM3625 TaxID=1211777 RepID=K0Q5X9_9HYPH|nr:hypothetical protein BN77_p11652 [Rhizobium mesoamericanum STM3625]